jgi:subtilisin family serine protease
MMTICHISSVFVDSVAVMPRTATVTLPTQKQMIILALDSSGSMRAKDVEPSRLVAMQNAAKQFVSEASPRTKIGVVTFAATATLVQPPTDDREAVIAALEAVAARQQSRLAPLLNRLVAEGAIIHVEPVAVVNRLVVTATAHGLLTLGASAEVAAVLPDWTSERAPAGSAEESTGPEVPLGGSFRSWAIDAMNVPPLWKEGVDGTGVVVAAIDTGAFESHEQLRGRRLPGARGWFDPVEGTTSGVDHHGHGTGVLVQAVGGNPEGRVVGMAHRREDLANPRGRARSAADTRRSPGRTPFPSGALRSRGRRSPLPAWRSTTASVTFSEGRSD